MTLFAKKVAAAGYTQTSLARALGCSQTSVFYWCSGRSMPSASHFLKVARLLKLTPDKLLAMFEPAESTSAAA